MAETRELPEITFADDDGQDHCVYVLQGDRRRGIGYEAGNAIIMSGGNVQPGTKASEQWMWSDHSGRYFTVNDRGLWNEITPGFGESSGWKLY